MTVLSSTITPCLQRCKKTFFVRYLDFQLRNVRITNLLMFVMILRMKLNKFLFSSEFYSFGVKPCNTSNLLFAIISSNYVKMSEFPSKNVRYPRYQDTNHLQLCLFDLIFVSTLNIPNLSLKLFQTKQTKPDTRTKPHVGAAPHHKINKSMFFFGHKSFHIRCLKLYPMGIISGAN